MVIGEIHFNDDSYITWFLYLVEINLVVITRKFVSSNAL